MYVHTIPRFKVLNEIAASGSLHLQVLATLIDGDKPELRSKEVYITFRETENFRNDKYQGEGSQLYCFSYVCMHAQSLSCV